MNTTPRASRVNRHNSRVRIAIARMRKSIKEHTNGSARAKREAHVAWLLRNPTAHAEFLYQRALLKNAYKAFAWSIGLFVLSAGGTLALIAIGVVTASPLPFALIYLWVAPIGYVTRRVGKHFEDNEAEIESTYQLGGFYPST